MAKATVKWFDAQKGFGFLSDPGVKGDIFVHHTQIKAEGYRKLEEGDTVEYELEHDPKGFRAKNVVKK